jgi:hypothetical protein
MDQSFDTSVAETSLLGVEADAILLEKRREAARRSAQGVKRIAIGAILGFLSCVLGLCNPVPGFYEVLLYGVTSVAIVLIFWGLYLIFE